MRIPRLAIVALVVAISACATAPVLEPPPIQSNAEPTQKQQVIAYVLKARRWSVQSEQPGQTLAVISGSNTSPLKVAVTYDANSVTVRAIDADGEVPSRANRWIRNLHDDLVKNLRVSPAPAAKPNSGAPLP